MTTNGASLETITCGLCGRPAAGAGQILGPGGPLPCPGPHPRAQLRPNDEIGVDYSTANGIAGNVAQQVEAAIEAGQPVTMPIIAGTAAKSGILSERRRVVSILQRMAAQVAEPMLMAMESARVAASLGRHGEHDQALGVARTSEVSLRAIQAAILMVTIDPSACKRCGGSQVVASTLVAGATVPCPSCAVAPTAVDRA